MSSPMSPNQYRKSCYCGFLCIYFCLKQLFMIHFPSHRDRQTKSVVKTQCGKWVKIKQIYLEEKSKWKIKYFFAIRLANSLKVGNALCWRGCGKSQALRGDSEVGMDDAATFLEGSWAISVQHQQLHSLWSSKSTSRNLLYGYTYRRIPRFM